MRMARERAALLGVRRGARDQVSAVFLATSGSENAERGPLRAVVSARSPGGGVLDVQSERAFQALRQLQEFLMLRGGDRMLVLVIHGVVEVRRSGELAMPFTGQSIVTSTQLRATLRACEIERQVVVVDCDVTFDVDPGEAPDDVYAKALEKAFKVRADERLVIARRPGDRIGLTPRLAEALNAGLASEAELYNADFIAGAARLGELGAAPIVLGETPMSAAEAAMRGLPDAPADAPGGGGYYSRRKRAEGAADEDAELVEMSAPESAAIERGADVGDGRLHHDAPRRMVVGRSYEVHVAVSRDPSETAARGLSGAVESHDVRVAGMMAVELRDPEDAFDVHPLCNIQQPIDHSFARALGFQTEPGPDRGFWVWRVRPRRHGAYPLCIHATAYVRDAQGQLVPAPEQNDRIPVRVTVNYGQVAGDTVKWLLVALAGFILIDSVGGPAAVGVLQRLRDATVEMLGIGAMF